MNAKEQLKKWAAKRFELPIEQVGQVNISPILTDEADICWEVSVYHPDDTIDDFPVWREEFEMDEFDFATIICEIMET